MGWLGRGCRGAAVAAIAVALPVLVGAPAGAADGPPTPSPEAPGPSPTSVEDARDAAKTVAAEVEELNGRLAEAEKQLRAIQLKVSEAVTAQERAEQAYADADLAARRAAAELVAARQAHTSADDALAGQAALIYMQGGSLQNLTALMLTPPNTMSDLAFVLEADARRTQRHLDVATAAEWEATTRESELSAARDSREEAAAKAAAARSAAEAEAKAAGEEAATLGAQQEELTARLAELEQTADDLLAQREAAAGQGSVELLGLQAPGAVGAGPAAAQQIARTAMPAFGWDQDREFRCLVTLWHHESGWSWSATNPSSGAYGIPQALPGWKMASAGSDWLTNPATQIAWGMGYIDDVYGSPCKALAAFNSRSPHWY